MAISPEKRQELRDAAAKRIAEAQAKCNEYNEAKELAVTPLGFRPAPGKYQGFNRRQRRDGTAKAWLLRQAEKADAKRGV